MGVAALITWVLTAGGGFVLLATWIAKGGVRQPRTSHFPPALVFGHLVLAAAGLIVWIIYLITKSNGLAWTGFVLLIPVALLGSTMLARWIPTYRGRVSVPANTAPAATPVDAPAERHFPVPVVAAHGLVAVATVVLVLLTALQVGGG